ncbi:hypothetical protein PR003_g6043 [Phytophthora rubi]|uniref:Uncharacterized protein n=1 Tax=Phytophthora rubi TaxID=129364 RepID=A0A6A3N024_9STRA|nr:hypothetical protein PR002_g5819 [Phytophthora rubi]KAE9044151.1 hypothetical protein PR001_g5492 [Phytophthora rubi]KAE9349164.1 hypothetical protein PR003_g6043 [Phytophthora rubi]
MDLNPHKSNRAASRALSPDNFDGRRNAGEVNGAQDMTLQGLKEKQTQISNEMPRHTSHGKHARAKAHSSSSVANEDVDHTEDAPNRASSDSFPESHYRPSTGLLVKPWSDEEDDSAPLFRRRVTSLNNPTNSRSTSAPA